jgi:predicted secreted protein
VLRHKGFPLNTQEEQAFNTTNQLMTQNDNPENLQNKMLQLYNQLQNIKHQRAMDQQNSTEMWRSVRDEDTEVIAKVRKSCIYCSYCVLTIVCRCWKMSSAVLCM